MLLSRRLASLGLVVLCSSLVLTGCGDDDPGGGTGGGYTTTASGATGGGGGIVGEVLLDVDFEPADVGPYTRPAMEVEWVGLQWASGLDEGRVHIVDGAEAHQGNSLRILYPQGGVGPGEGGAQWLVHLPAGHDELYCAYWIKFQSGFDFVLGGKIPGLGGGDNNTGGSIPDGTDGWSGRMMWRSGGDAVQYVYHPDQPGTWGEDLAWDIGGQRSFPPGQWVHVEHRFVMNTPGQSDGLVQGWWNGELVLDHSGMRFRDVDTFAVDVFYFSTFFGGSGSDWAPTKDEHIYFDDFIVATGPISH